MRCHLGQRVVPVDARVSFPAAATKVRLRTGSLATCLVWDGTPLSTPAAAEGFVKTLGFLCNCPSNADPRRELSASLYNRAVLLDRALRPAGIEVFLYCPGEVTGDEPVPGHCTDGDGGFRPDSRALPAVNANWTYGTRKLLNKGMGYKPFKRFVRERGIEIYVPFEFSERVSNKRKAFEMIHEVEPTLHPHTEDYQGNPAQLARFFERSPIVFVKPRAGNRGNGIFVLRPRGSDACSVRYFEHANQREFSRLDFAAAISMINGAADDKAYVIQEGIDSLRFEDAVFDVRVVAVNDGQRWHEILETRLAPIGSDLSNIFQGGSIRMTEDVLRDTLGEQDAKRVEGRIRSTSLALAENLDQRFPAQIMELGFDFVLDPQLELHLVEINAKPGVAGLGSEAKVFEWREEDAHFYEKWVHPHIGYLAQFLRDKVEARG